MASDKQDRANRRNAQKSTGPKTGSGKHRVRLNALKHGVRAETVAIPGEDPEEFEALRQSVWAECQPRGSMEKELVERIVLSIWRLRRVANLEATIIRGYHLEITAGVVEGALHLDNKIYEDKEAKPVLALYEELSADRLLAHSLEIANRLLGTLLRYEVTIERSLHRNRQELEVLQTARKSKTKKPTQVIDIVSDQPAKATPSPGQRRSPLRRTRWKEA